MFTFALAGRGVIECDGLPQGVASLALGYGGHWAFSPLWVDWAMRYHCLFSPLGLTGLCATMTFQPASFDRDEQSVTYSWYAEDPFKIRRPRGPSKEKKEQQIRDDGSVRIGDICVP